MMWRGSWLLYCSGCGRVTGWRGGRGGGRGRERKRSRWHPKGRGRVDCWGISVKAAVKAAVVRLLVVFKVILLMSWWLNEIGGKVIMKMRGSNWSH